MERIRNHKELYSHWESLRFHQELLSHRDLPPEVKPTLENNIVSIKRTIREYYKRTRCDFDNDERVISDYGIDGYIVLIPLPKTVNDPETAEEWFLDNEYLQTRYSAYDCTGDLFTSWYKIVNRNGRFYAYHRVSCDC